MLASPGRARPRARASSAVSA